MNLKQAKRLRKMIGYHPSQEREYTVKNRKPVFAFDEKGEMILNEETGMPEISHYTHTVVNSVDTSRKFYQAIKRNASK